VARCRVVGELVDERQPELGDALERTLVAGLARPDSGRVAQRRPLLGRQLDGAARSDRLIVPVSWLA
jgi:hypothetical protein